MNSRYKKVAAITIALFAFSCDKSDDQKATHAYDANKGKAVYAVHCHSCHGEAGSGDGFMGSKTATKPRNYKEEGFYYGSDFAAIRKTIKKGIVQNGMPAFDSILSEEELNAVSMYIRNTLGL